MKSIDICKDELEKLITQFEKETKTELIIAVTPASSHYPEAKFRGAVFLSFFLVLMLEYFINLPSGYLLLSVTVFSTVLFYYFFPFNQFNFFKLKKEKEIETRQKAEQTFLSFHHHENAHHGILLFLSLEERKVQLLLGSDIVPDISPEDLDNILNIMRGYFRKNDFGKGLIESIQALQKLIKEKYQSDKPISENFFGNHIHYIN